MSNDSARVLIIDASEGMQQLYTSLIEEVGATMRLAGTWDAARAALEEQPDVIVVDALHLMNGEGRDILREHLQRAPACRLIVTVSAPGQGEQVREAMASDQVETLVMPFEIEDFERRISRNGSAEGSGGETA